MREAWGNRPALRWSRPSLWRREFELRSGDELVATLRISGALQPTGVVKIFDGVWTFRRRGFFQKTATIRASGQTTDVAEFRARAWTAGGELTFASGSRFWLRANMWMTRLDVRTSAGEPVMFIHRHGLCGRTADVAIAPEARALPEIQFLATFGWYLFVMFEQDAGGVFVTG